MQKVVKKWVIAAFVVWMFLILDVNTAEATNEEAIKAFYSYWKHYLSCKNSIERINRRQYDLEKTLETFNQEEVSFKKIILSLLEEEPSEHNEKILEETKWSLIKLVEKKECLLEEHKRLDRQALCDKKQGIMYVEKAFSMLRKAFEKD